MAGLALSRRQALALAGAMLLVLVVVGKQWRGGEQQTGGEARGTLRADGLGRATASAFVVHVVGAVRRPGLYRLPIDARIADAVRRAGGATRRADLALVNLAAPLADGTQVVVPRRVEQTGGTAAGADPAAAAGPVHLNTATLEDLDALPGVGPVTAQKIIDFREEHGAFSSVDELDAIPGIGPARLEQLREVAAP
jgi:competence protein ComEA